LTATRLISSCGPATQGTPTITANIYTHLDLRDVAGAVQSLPSMTTTRAVEAVKNGGRNLPLFLPLDDGFSMRNPAILRNSLQDRHSDTARPLSTYLLQQIGELAKEIACFYGF